MRSVSLNAKVLIEGFQNDSPWPGTPETIQLNNEVCPPINGDKPKFLVEQGFVVKEGESLEGEVNESQGSGLLTGWTYYTQEDAAALINGWALAGLEWHAATKIYCSNNPEVMWVVSDTVFDVQAAINVCCGAPNVQTQAFVFVESNRQLIPGNVYSCPADAKYKWLAIRGTNDIRNLGYRFSADLKNADDTVNITNDSDPIVSFGATIQAVRHWPDGFVGMTFDTTTLVANDQVPGFGELRVGEFDGGTIKVRTEIIDIDTDELVAIALQEWAIPESCDIFEDSFSDEFE